MITVYRIRHTETGVDENNPRKKKPNKNLSTLGRNNGQRIAQYLIDKKIKYLYTSQFTRSNELGHIISRYLSSHSNVNIKVNTTPLLNEWWIPSIWGKKYTELNKYLHWRSSVFQNQSLDSRFDSDSETLRELLNRVVQFNEFLSTLDGNAVYISHSQYIATDLTNLIYGPSLTSSHLIKGFDQFFPKRHGTIAITTFENSCWNVIDHSYIKHLPHLPK